MAKLKLLIQSFTFKLILFIGILVVGYSPIAQSQKYFQQKVNVKIDVKLNDSTHELSAYEKIEYTNNSPDTIVFMYFHLWPNAYSNNKTELAKQIFRFKGKQKLFNNPELAGSIDSLDFKVDGLPVRWILVPNQLDISKIMLNAPLLPGGKILITTPFHVKIPKGVTSRMGHINQSYQISQWFPKPAVYDKDGWHPISYLDQGEFYSEFGSFDVNITLPKNYIVAATGELQNKKELEMLDSLAADTLWKSIKMLGKVKKTTSTNQTKTLRYTGKNMHDFAWFADKQFNVMKGKVTLPKSGKEITTWIMCTHRQARLWKNALEYTDQAILGLSNLIGDYPYSNFTIVQSALSAGLGMEYPGLAVIGITKNAYSLDEVITHEAGHTWFYGALGSNERRYPFMDESITSNYEERYMTNKYPDKKLWEILFKKEKQAKFFHVDKLPLQRMQELTWLTASRNNIEQPINLASTDYESMNYSQMIYNKGSMGFNYLRAYLGDSVYDSAMQSYYLEWKFRHPQPENLRNAFEKQTDKEVSWFFDDFLGTTKRLDYKIEKLENHKLLVKNNGELNSPIVICGLNGDSICFEKWTEGFEGEKWIDIPQGNYSEIKIDPNHVMPEMYRLNNNIRTSGIFPTSDPLVTQLLFTVENPEKRTLMYIPAVNWNKYDGFMIGMAFHNGLISPKPLEYLILPFYAFNNSSLAGYGRIAYNIIPYNNFFRKISFILEGIQFGAPGRQNYQKVMSGVELNFRTNSITSPFRQKVYGRYIVASDLDKIQNGINTTMNSFVQFGYNLQKTGLINPGNLMASLELNKAYQKVSLDLNYKYSYNGKGNGLEIRGFAGSMLNNTSTVPFYSLAASGRSGNELYLYDDIYPNRFGVFPESFWTRQMNRSEGGIISPINQTLGFSKWLISLSLTSSLPGKASLTGIKPFVNLLINDHGLSTGYKSVLFAEAGFKIGILDIFEIYVPLLVSNNIQSINGTIKDRVRVVLNLDLSKQLK
ncbi:MAG: M1 family metallopeptidase [Paludibacter sp.]|nr:M1 family metallopeptidase [Paludibacter sp.]